MLDDICVTGAIAEDPFNNLTDLLTRFPDAGLRLNAYKCTFYQECVKFLGKIVDKNDQSMDPAAFEALKVMPVPTRGHTLRSSLGHMSYIMKYVADFKTARAPFDGLLKKEVKFVWTDQHRKTFENCNALAGSSTITAHKRVRAGNITSSN